MHFIQELLDAVNVIQCYKLWEKIKNVNYSYVILLINILFKIVLYKINVYNLVLLATKQIINLVHVYHK